MRLYQLSQRVQLNVRRHPDDYRIELIERVDH